MFDQNCSTEFGSRLFMLFAAILRFLLQFANICTVLISFIVRKWKCRNKSKLFFIL